MLDVQTSKRGNALRAELYETERARESHWLRHRATTPMKLRWRALTVRHCFHVLPGETILELGAGSGIWTEHLADVLRGENPVAAATFNRGYADAGRARRIPNARFMYVEDPDEIPAGGFDYVVGTNILGRRGVPENLEAVHRLLKPGGQFIFFEANSRRPGNRRDCLARAASAAGFTSVEAIPYDMVPAITPQWLVDRHALALAVVLEHAPGIRNLCGSVCVWGRKAGGAQSRPAVNLAEHRHLFGSTSVVVPCHNEESNVRPLVEGLVGLYGDYIREIILVDDNSTDGTAEAAARIGAEEPRVRVIRRSPPNGVGCALRDGYAAATGRYILSMDCDFVHILPEFRDLWDAVAAGHDGAIGSRFSHDSVLINYPFRKILANRLFHWAARLLLRIRIRDVSNNLKLYRAEILKKLAIEQPHFAANAETGLKPLVARYDIVEVAISWINRTAEMGTSSFRVGALAPAYARALLRTVWRAWRGRHNLERAPGNA